MTVIIYQNQNVELTPKLCLVHYIYVYIYMCFINSCILKNECCQSRLIEFQESVNLQSNCKQIKRLILIDACALILWIFVAQG